MEINNILTLSINNTLTQFVNPGVGLMDENKFPITINPHYPIIPHALFVKDMYTF